MVDDLYSIKTAFILRWSDRNVFTLVFAWWEFVKCAFSSRHATRDPLLQRLSRGADKQICLFCLISAVHSCCGFAQTNYYHDTFWSNKHHYPEMQVFLTSYTHVALWDSVWSSVGEMSGLTNEPPNHDLSRIFHKHNDTLPSFNWNPF